MTLDGTQCGMLWMFLLNLGQHLRTSIIKAHVEWQDYWNKIPDYGRKAPPKKRRKKPAFLNDFIA